MCGGQLDIIDGATVCTCDYCGTEQTLPRLDSDKKQNLYDRANHFRRNNDYDKAMSIYEQILNEDNTDAESYWSLVICKYGIEYVEDPTSHKRIPTVNRAQYTSIFDDEDYKSALKYADTLQKTIYKREAKTINEIQKGILAISNEEEPFLVLIAISSSMGGFGVWCLVVITLPIWIPSMARIKKSNKEIKCVKLKIHELESQRNSYKGR